MPESAAALYPNELQSLFDTPAIVFRDHRWTLPVIYRAAELGLISLPVRLVTFDRHRDSLVPEDDNKILDTFRRRPKGFDELIHIVKFHLSPRDDDWIIAGMELGLISDVIQFGSGSGASEDCCRDHKDCRGDSHRIFHLGRPVSEISYKGALADVSHAAAAAGLWETLELSQERCEFAGGDPLVFDIDLDYFTLAWEKYTLPYNDELFRGEFLTDCQSARYDDCRPTDLVKNLVEHAGIVSIATEPQFCDGVEKTRSILSNMNRYLFDSQLDIDTIDVDYHPPYPTE